MRSTVTTSGGRQTQWPWQNDNIGRSRTQNFADDIFLVAFNGHTQVQPAANIHIQSCERKRRSRTIHNNNNINISASSIANDHHGCHDHVSDTDDCHRPTKEPHRQTVPLRAPRLQQEFRQSDVAATAFEASLERVQVCLRCLFQVFRVAVEARRPLPKTHRSQTVQLSRLLQHFQI